MHRSLTTAWLAAALLALLTVTSASAAPRGADPNAPAYVDLERVLAEYQKTAAFNKYAQRVQAQAKVYSDEMDFLAQLRYASDAERKEALALKAKPGPSEREKDRLDALLKKSDDIDAELARLSQKQSPSAEDTRRIGDISQMRTKAVRSLAKEEADRRDLLHKLDSDTREEVEIELLKVVEKVAKDQKLPFIYERRAVLFGGNDYTDDVVKKLPK